MSFNQKTILLVEDEALVALAETQQLQEKGYSVVHTFNGEEAIAIVKAAQPAIDLILMDINLGHGIDGIRAAQEILHDFDTPVVFLSSHTEQEIVEKTEKINSYGYVVKNSGITVLDASIKMALKLYAAYQTIQQSNITLAREITERQLAEEELRRQATWQKFISDAVIVTDIQTIITDWNEAATSIYSWNANKAIGCESDVLLGTQFINVSHKEAQNILSQTGLWRGHLEQRTKSGNLLYIEASMTLLKNEAGKIIGGITVNRDITEQKKVEMELINSEARFKSLFMSLSEGFYLSKVLYDDDGNPCDYIYLETNPQFEWIVGLSREKIIGKRYKEIVPVDSTKWLENFFHVALTGEPRTFEFYSPEYQTHYLTYSYKPEKDQVSVFVLDITKRKKIEESLRESEENYKQLLEATSDSIYVLDRDWNFVVVNEAATHFVQISREKLLGHNMLELFPGIEQTEFFKTFNHVMKSKQSDTIISEFHFSDSRSGWYEVHVDHVPNGILCVSRDISANKQAEEALQQALADKEILMRELLHRVKNTLTTVASLIDLERQNLFNENDCAIFDRTRIRVRTIATLYDHLNQENSQNAIKLDYYIKTIVDYLLQAYSYNTNPIKVKTQLAAIELDSKRAMSIGLIVNELVTNALKYAFTAESPGTIQVKLTDAEKNVMLFVADNGVGMASSSINLEYFGLGLTLVDMLTRQLDGKMTIEGDNGVKVKVIFEK